ncbi:hypothetical protein K2V56_01635 [Staphylococcus chromogenes]|uniref:hypothetical protein n=1 Tax=Staphylococcus chromogenes TaxID=46126 RepID=UPI001E5DF3CB|nr:hypothetical protein [Staphylococcus chromogenes]MCD8904165.1 hypothetical protein [Staphylococcus chromogenes]
MKKERTVIEFLEYTLKIEKELLKESPKRGEEERAIIKKKLNKKIDELASILERE